MVFPRNDNTRGYPRLRQPLSYRYFSVFLCTLRVFVDILSLGEEMECPRGNILFVDHQGLFLPTLACVRVARGHGQKVEKSPGLISEEQLKVGIRNLLLFEMPESCLYTGRRPSH